jgi:hypothetical protein
VVMEGLEKRGMAGEHFLFMWYFCRRTGSVTTRRESRFYYYTCKDVRERGRWADE